MMIRQTMLRWGIAAVAVMVSVCAAERQVAAAEEPTAKQTGAEIRELTGAHTRIVWLQDGGDEAAPWGAGPKTRLVGLDTDDGKGIRPIIREQGGISWAYFTPDGKGIGFTRMVDGSGTVMYVNWDGTGLRKLVSNAWLAGISGDPEGKYVWFYCQSDEGGKLSIKRYRLDKPSVNALVWDKNKTIGRFTVSTDGMLGAGVYDNPGTGPCGVFRLPNVEWIQAGNGCQPCMMPGVDPYRLFVFHGDHRTGSIFTNPADPAKRTQQRLSFGEAFGVANRYEISYPKWSNNIRFMLLSSPFTTARNEDGIPFPGCEKMDGKYKSYHEKVEISMGRLDEGLTRIEKWVRITDNSTGDYLPEAWIAKPDTK